jgi:hypothetical protein
MSVTAVALATAAGARVICLDMRYSRWALLVFGAGMVLGLAVVSAGLSNLARIASLTMAAGIVLLPVALFADWRGPAKPAKRRPKPKAKQRASPRRGTRRKR